jgi:predicted O-methyltransferase YrrM
MFNENWYSDSQCNELIKLLKIVENIEGQIIEIGCWEGKSTINIANTCYPQKLICNDTWLGNIEESKCSGIKHITEIILEQRDVYNIFINNMNISTKGNYEIVKRDCIEWLKEYDNKIKFIHIDASHEYDSVHKTIELILPKMVKGGIICGDDFQNANINRVDLNGGVERAVRELLPKFENIDNLWFWINK